MTHHAGKHYKTPIQTCSTFVLGSGIVIDRNDFFNIFYSNISQKWIDNRMTGKITFLASLIYLITTYALLLSHPSLILWMYCITFPTLFAVRIYSYTKSKSFLFLFDNCYFVNTALICYLWLNLPPSDTFFLSIFAAVNGPVLWAVLPFRNTMAFHDLDKMTSCYIHWAPTLVTWLIRWFPMRTSIGWFRDFEGTVDDLYQWQGGFDWLWFVAVPLGFLVVHDVIYSVVVHILVRPTEEYSDSFTYQRSKDNIVGNSISKCPEILQLPFYMMMSLLMYLIAILISILCYRMFLIHTSILLLQLLIMLWNGGCYYLDYFAYLATKASMGNKSNENSAEDSLVDL